MNRVVGWLVVAGASAGCGDNPRPLSEDALLAQLRALPGVTIETSPYPGGEAKLPEGFRYYVLEVTQPIDHEDPGQGTFRQRVQLLHHNELASHPLVVNTAGYWDDWGHVPTEITKLVGANQISIEHRYFGASRPAVLDWSKLTIKQAADDEHEVIAALRTIYGGPVLTTGGSKGGMAAMFHRRFYPDDVDGTVAYVTPLSMGEGDAGYQDALDAQSTTPCRQGVRNAAIQMIAQRDALVALASAQPDHTYSRVLIAPAVEAAIASLEWGFWQTRGVTACAMVPAISASASDLFAFLEYASPVHEYDDVRLAQYAPYEFQSHTQLGYPREEPSYLTLEFTEADYVGELPPEVVEPDDDRGKHGQSKHGGHEPDEPRLKVPFDAGAMTDVGAYFQQHGERVLLLYGGGDPWSARPFALGGATSSAVLTQPDATHRTVAIGHLAPADRARAYALLAAWTGVEPVVRSDEPAVERESDERAPRARAAHAPSAAK